MDTKLVRGGSNSSDFKFMAFLINPTYKRPQQMRHRGAVRSHVLVE